jgi:hypothetical protein
MDDYISRPKMLSVLRGGFFPQDVVYTEAVAIAKQIIESAPAEEDVVKVVRCKDCKKVWGEVNQYCGAYCGLHKRWFDKNAFCSCGERKEQNGVQKEENQKRTPTHWTLGWSCTLELGFDDGKYLPRKAAILLYPQYFDEKGEPIKSVLPIGRSGHD